MTLLDVIRCFYIQEIIQKYYECNTNHEGIYETEERIKNTYYWTYLKKSSQLFVN